MTKPIATTRGNQMFAVNSAKRPQLQPGTNRKPQPPKYVVSYQRLGSSNWQHVESPFTVSKKAALTKLQRYVDSPLRCYLHCAFQVKRLSDQFIVIHKEHRSVKSQM